MKRGRPYLKGQRISSTKPLLKANRPPSITYKPRLLVTVRHSKSTIHLEEPFRLSLKEIAAQEGCSVSALVSRIDAERKHANVTSAVRLFVLDHYYQLAESRKRPTVKQRQQWARQSSRKKAPLNRASKTLSEE